MTRTTPVAHRDFSLDCDPRGTCPSCRRTILHIDRVPFAADGPRPRIARAVVCRTCGYVCEIGPADTVDGLPAEEI